MDRSCLPVADADPDKAAQQRAVDMAVQVLWALSGRQFGVCPYIVRPCPTACMVGPVRYGPGWFPMWSDGQWRNVSCDCPGQCSYSGPSVIHLPGPVDEVLMVVIDGVALDPGSWVLEGPMLYRTGGVAWPRQNLHLPIPEPGTWFVEYLRGIPVPAGVDVLVGKLALEFYNACTGGKCHLPRRVQSLTRQGVSYQMIDPTDVYTAGHTGIPEIDLWLSAVNPNHLMQPPAVR